MEVMFFIIVDYISDSYTFKSVIVTLPKNDSLYLLFNIRLK